LVALMTIAFWYGCGLRLRTHEHFSVDTRTDTKCGAVECIFMRFVQIYKMSETTNGHFEIALYLKARTKTIIKSACYKTKKIFFMESAT
jgi:hypothetical protein